MVSPSQEASLTSHDAPKKRMRRIKKDTELEKAAKQFDEFDKQVKDLTLDQMNKAPKQEREPQTQLSQKEIANSRDIYLKPKKTAGHNHKFNENHRDQWNYAKQYVQFIAENVEVIGESIQLWTYPFGGVPCEFWEVPVNKPVWGPRYLAEQISRCNYHRLKMQDNTQTSQDGMGTYTGALVVDQVVSRLDARPVSQSKNVFIGRSF